MHWKPHSLKVKKRTFCITIFPFCPLHMTFFQLCIAVFYFYFLFHPFTITQQRNMVHSALIIAKKRIVKSARLLSNNQKTMNQTMCGWCSVIKKPFQLLHNILLSDSFPLHFTPERFQTKDFNFRLPHFWLNATVHTETLISTKSFCRIIFR
jgi:hypothetical protein